MSERKISIKSWLRVVSVLKPELRAAKYAQWRKTGEMKEVEIQAIEKAYPPVPPGEKAPPGIGFGDAIRVVTDFLHIPPCGGCKQRQEDLNKFRIG